MSDRDLLATTTSILRNSLTELEGTLSANRTNMTLVTRMVSVSAHLPIANEPRITSGEYITFHLASVSSRVLCLWKRKLFPGEQAQFFLRPLGIQAKARRARSTSLRSSLRTRYKDTDTDTRRERENFSEFSIWSRVHRVSRAHVFHVLVYFACSYFSLARLVVVEITHSRTKKWHTLHAKDICKRSCWPNWLTCTRVFKSHN